MAEYCCEIQRIENLKIIRGNLKTCKTGAALMAEIAAAVARCRKFEHHLRARSCRRCGG